MAKRHDEDESILRTLKDGERMHFSMMAMDSGGEVLPAHTFDGAAPLRVVDAFGNSGLALNKPGSRHLAARNGTPDNAAMVMRDHQRRNARDQYVADLQDAWKGNNKTDREVARKHDTGNPIADAWLDQLDDLQNSWARGSGRR